jgi:hypothetical protein
VLDKASRMSRRAIVSYVVRRMVLIAKKGDAAKASVGAEVVARVRVHEGIASLHPYSCFYMFHEGQIFLIGARRINFRGEHESAPACIPT